MNIHYLLSSCAVIAVTFLLALALTGRVRTWLVARAMMDIPNDRSSHKTPVPRGGGWALLAILIPALAGALYIYDGDLHRIGILAAVFLLAAISWIDDRHDINAILRLGAHILAASLGASAFSHDQTLFGGAIPFGADRAVMILGWAWFINLYNFMDGIDGMTGVETIALATGLCLCLTAAAIADPVLDFMTLALTGSCLGFLAYNWHPAKIFLGDVGSVPLGYITGFGLLTLATHGQLAAALILPLYYLADSGITITRRALRGEKIWQAHREHFYQKAAIGAGRHDHVVLWVLAGNSGLIAAAMLSITRPMTGLATGIAFTALLLFKLNRMKPRNALTP